MVGGGGSTQLGPIGKATAQRFRIDLIIDNVMCNRYGCINAQLLKFNSNFG